MADSLPDASGILARKVGGIKVQWLILIAAAGLVGGVVWRRYRGEPGGADIPLTAAPLPEPDPADVGDGVYSTAAGNQLGGGFAYGGNGSGTSTYSTIGTNAQWAVNASNGLTATGQYSPLDIQNALSNYITGVPLTNTQQAIVNAAIAAYGSPPEAVLPSTNVNPPASTSRTVAGWRRSPTGIYVIYTDNTFSKVSKAQYAAAGSPPLKFSTTIGHGRTLVPYIAGSAT